jgi:hypothetical protein
MTIYEQRSLLSRSVDVGGRLWSTLQIRIPVFSVGPKNDLTIDMTIPSAAALMFWEGTNFAQLSNVCNL